MLAAVRDAVVRYKTWPALQQRALQEMVTEICAEDEVQVENEGEFEETTKSRWERRAPDDEITELAL